MIGKRVEPNERGWLTDILKPGEYCKIQPTTMADGSPLPDWIDKQYPSWQACTPNGHQGNLGNHDVIEHEDGTITVSPSILISDSNGPVWHGYLEHGIWRTV